MYSLKKFENYKIDDIINCIDESPIGNVRPEPGHTNTEKIKSEKFGLIMTKNTERKVSNMCNWSELLVEEEREQGIRILIEDNIEEGKSKDIIIGKLICRYGLSEEVAKKYIDEVCAISL